MQFGFKTLQSTQRKSEGIVAFDDCADDAATATADPASSRAFSSEAGAGGTIAAVFPFALFTSAGFFAAVGAALAFAAALAAAVAAAVAAAPVSFAPVAAAPAVFGAVGIVERKEQPQ